jgi:hypothetical protein
MHPETLALVPSISIVFEVKSHGISGFSPKSHFSPLVDTIGKKKQQVKPENRIFSLFVKYLAHILHKNFLWKTSLIIKEITFIPKVTSQELPQLKQQVTVFLYTTRCGYQKLGSLMLSSASHEDEVTTVYTGAVLFPCQAALSSTRH